MIEPDAGPDGRLRSSSRHEDAIQDGRRLQVGRPAQGSASFALRRRRPALAAGMLLAAVALVGLVGAVGGDEATPRSQSAADAVGGVGGPAAATVSPATGWTSDSIPAVPLPASRPTSTAAPRSTISHPLSRGSAGSDVKALQQRLSELSFRPGPADGQFGDLTRMAVWAYQKLVMGVPYDEPDGIVTPAMWLALQEPLPVRARRPRAGVHTEVYLPQQVLVVFDGDTPTFISHISSGQLVPPGDDFTKGQEWCAEVTIDPGEFGNADGTQPIQQGVCGNAWTPGGAFHVDRKIAGRRQSRLGGLLNPVYFNYGIAVHGASNVPLQPASHGCIRIPNAISREFYDLVDLKQDVLVWDGVKEPEAYGAQSGIWDWADPAYTTTTTPASTTTSTLRPTPATTMSRTPRVTTPTASTPSTTTTTSTVAVASTVPVG